MIARRGRTIFTPSNLSEVRLRFERILARIEDKVAGPLRANREISDTDELDAETPVPDRVDADHARKGSRTPSASGARIARGSRRARLTLAELYLELRARALEEDERRRRLDRQAPRMGASHADGKNRNQQQAADDRS